MLKRPAEPPEIAACVLFLASDEASYVHRRLPFSPTAGETSMGSKPGLETLRPVPPAALTAKLGSRVCFWMEYQEWLLSPPTRLGNLAAFFPWALRPRLSACRRIRGLLEPSAGAPGDHH